MGKIAKQKLDLSLREVFGHDELRPDQKEVIDRVLKGEDVLEPGVPESFKVLVKELQSLGLSVEVSNDEGGSVSFIDETANDLPELGLNLSGFEREEDFFNARSQ